MRKGFQVALSIAISALLVGAALLSLLTLLRGALSSEALRRALEALAAFSGARRCKTRMMFTFLMCYSCPLPLYMLYCL